MSGMKLSAKRFESARNFIQTQARPLEKACFTFHFEDGPADAVFEELQTYQNPDGGFGNGLEPDLRASESSVICTSVAFQILGASQPHPQSEAVSKIKEKAVAYLLGELDIETYHWRIIPAQLADSPRAPWWQESGRGASFDDFALNPTAEILGIVWEHDLLYLNDIRKNITAKVMDAISTLDEIEMHDLYCCLRLLKAPGFPKDLHNQLEEMLTVLVRKTLVTDPDKWGQYGLRPLDVIDSPKSTFMAGLEDTVAANLNYVLEEQGEDGAWMPTWTWGDAYPEAWEQARVEWAGIITLGKLMTLHKFGRIEM